MRRISAFLLIFTSVPGTAIACTDDSAIKAIFSLTPPVEKKTPFVRVSDLRVQGQVVHAKLISGYQRLSSDEDILVEVPDDVQGTNCIELGPVDVPVFVAGRLIRTATGKLSLVAVPTKFQPLHRRRSDAELDAYIVDPEFKRQAEKDRRQNDR